MFVVIAQTRAEKRNQSRISYKSTKVTVMPKGMAKTPANGRKIMPEKEANVKREGGTDRARHWFQPLDTEASKGKTDFGMRGFLSSPHHLK